jgi:ubiquinol-cytochrome c reductase cytochrome c subunit
MSRGRTHRIPLLPLFPVAGAALLALLLVGTADATAQEPAADGRALYAAGCASCHGPAGEGVEGRGPTLVGEGEAAVDFVLRTGRMPLAEPGRQAERGPVRYTEAEIEALVAHVGAWGDGPAIPTVDLAGAVVVAGGDLYRLNCAACHVASGTGAVIGGGRTAPNLMEAPPVQIAEAVRIGPGAMPVFDELDDGEVADLAAYIVELQGEGTDDPDALGGVGPVAEGLAAWGLVLAPLVFLTRWIGRAHRDRSRFDRDPAPDSGADDEEITT